MNVAFVAPVIWLISTDRLFNPDFVNRWEWLSRPENLNNVATFVIVGAVLIVGWGIIDSSIKAYRNRH
ncbi:hypothetical protein FXF53_09740 [Micromonospora sp. WP24]|uniref:hypothetical protein n=1 Tax=Micromonospora sp. WP24 TaxID=2604469 RepID=UPI0011D34548|nr:hypothetical protein [Micromonospora sp. WP24]TYC02338.1 hypothetical protein FXF53_09740 [Micromonospora sp. WP24]